jgi:RHS repeat-associated protein
MKVRLLSLSKVPVRDVKQKDHYYPFGLNISALSSTAPLSKPNKINTFQGQEKVDDFDINWIQFKWRNHDPTIGRFFNVDPLSEKFYYNSPYAFSENKVVAHVELEGLESVSINASARGIVSAEVLGVTGSASIGVTVGTSNQGEGLYVVPTLTMGGGLAGGHGVSVGVTGSFNMGDIEDMKGVGSNFGGFMSVPGVGLQGGFDINSSGAGIGPNRIGGKPVSWGAGAGLYLEATATFFLSEPISVNDLGNSELSQQIGEIFQVGTEGVEQFIKDMTDVLQQNVDRVREEVMKPLPTKNGRLEDRLIIESDNTRANQRLPIIKN